jgi:quercetin dioxygenase-like cupin family protein
VDDGVGIGRAWSAVDISEKQPQNANARGIGSSKNHLGRIHKMKQLIVPLVVASLAVFPAALFCRGADQEIKLAPKVIRLDSGGKDYLRILGGPPETCTMHSGLVTLTPGKSVGIHSTKKYEELIVVIEGKGVMEITGGPTLQFAKGEVLYCPPNTEHNVTNMSEGTLMYLYVVAEAKM